MSEPEGPGGPLWERAYRDAQVVGVSFPERTIEVVVIPYETEALVPHPTERRMVRETIARGAFDGIQRRASRVRANRDHDEARTFGRAVAFHPSRDEGLVAELRVARTPLGDETLELAQDGCLDASAAFLPMPGGLHWLTRAAYRVTKAWLGHIALVPDPAHQGTAVLAVRAAEALPAGPRPRLDEWKAWRLQQRVGSQALDR